MVAATSESSRSSGMHMRTCSHPGARPNFTIDYPASLRNPADVLARIRLSRKPTKKLLRGLGVRDETAYDTEFIGGFVSRRLLPV